MKQLRDVLIPNQPGGRLLLGCWLLLTLLNIGKAYHIDDTFHLEAAAHLRSEPLKPMSGAVNWDHDPAPLQQFNQPPLFFYLLAAWTGIFGTSEVATHILLSFFTFAALYFFWRLALLAETKRPGFLLLLFAACPALAINQNLMVDIPLLACLLGGVYYYLAGIRKRDSRFFAAAGVLLAFAVLTKYTALPIIAALGLLSIASGHWRRLIVVIIPLLALAIWSAWNVLEYGAIHLLDRPRKAGDFHIHTLWTFLACLGSIAVFIPAYFQGRVNRWWAIPIALLWPIGFTMLYLLFVTGTISEDLTANTLRTAFTFTGIVLTLFIVSRFVRLDKTGRRVFPANPDVIFITLFSTLFAFLLLFAPFAATRHVLLLVPLILLVGRDWLSRAHIAIRGITGIGAIMLTLALGVSDWYYADYYRKMAQNIAIPEGQTVWSSGHWGWQWYTAERGWPTFSTHQTPLKAGDWIVFPGDIPRQGMPEGLRCDTIQRHWEPANWQTLVSGKQFGSLYNSYFNKPPWILSRRAIDTIFVCEVRPNYALQRTISRIKNDSTWMESIREKAVGQGLPIDSMVIRDARWLLQQEESQ